MILPTKRLTADRALLTVGAEVLLVLAEGARTVSQVWAVIHRRREKSQELAVITYDWFVLALDLLFAIGAIEWGDGKLSRRVAA